jgi:hypothetical protein
MQTFLPYASYRKSAQILDRQRLGKQRVESYQILRKLAGLSIGKGWTNHPAVKMWEGHGLELIQYNIAICEEWISRGYKDTVLQKTISLEQYFTGQDSKPELIGNRKFHVSHQSNLVRKLPTHYRKFFPEVSDSLPYVWGDKND